APARDGDARRLVAALSDLRREAAAARLRRPHRGPAGKGLPPAVPAARRRLLPLPGLSRRAPAHPRTQRPARRLLQHRARAEAAGHPAHRVLLARRRRRRSRSAGRGAGPGPRPRGVLARPVAHLLPRLAADQPRRPLKKAHLRRWRPRPHAQRRGLRLACASRAPPRIWTFLSACISRVGSSAGARPSTSSVTRAALYGPSVRPDGP